MKIYVAEEAGFCFGVRRALDLIDDLYEKGQNIQVYGQLVHNSTVLDKLKARGITCIDSLSQLSQLSPNHHLVVRTHGIPREEETRLNKENIQFTDATCPLVKKLHKIAESVGTQTVNSRFVIVGDPTHPEIIAAKSYAPSAEIIQSVSQARAFQCQPNEPVDIMVQTTYDADRFKEVIGILESKTRHLKMHRTICKATIVRQDAAKRLAPEVDAMVVIGGKQSSNTRKLYTIARERNANTFHVESYEQLCRDIGTLMPELAHCLSIGITAGASTPPDEIQKVKTFFANFNSNRAKEINHG